MAKETEKLEKLKIIVVDDSDFSRRSMVEILEAEGHIIVGESGDAESAMKIGLSSSFDLMIVDVVMPNISGIELIKALKEKVRDKRYIITSSLDIESVVIEAISSGASDFLRKPFDKKDLIKSINKILDMINQDRSS